MNEEDKILRQLTIKSFHVNKASESDCFSISKLEDLSQDDAGIVTKTSPQNMPYYSLEVNTGFTEQINASDDLIVSSSIRVLNSDQHNIHVNSIMDIVPISVKALGRIGEGITHTLTGVYVVLTGHDTQGNQICAFGNSDGMLNEQIKFGRAGTPDESDILILVDVCLKDKAGYARSGPDAIHRACDLFCDEIRSKLKCLKGRDCTESHVFNDIERPGKRRVAIVKMVPGQGAMYDCRYLADNPSGFTGGHSVIDAEGAPMILSPNEYRDGAIRALV